MLTGGAAGPVRPDVGRTETGEACRGSSQAAMLDRLGLSGIARERLRRAGALLGATSGCPK